MTCSRPKAKVRFGARRRIYLKLPPSVLVGAVASGHSVTPLAALTAPRLMGRRTPGRLVLLDRLRFRFGASALGVGELFGDKTETAPDRTRAAGSAVVAFSTKQP